MERSTQTGIWTLGIPSTYSIGRVVGAVLMLSRDCGWKFKGSTSLARLAFFLWMLHILRVSVAYFVSRGEQGMITGLDGVRCIVAHDYQRDPSTVLPVHLLTQVLPSVKLIIFLG